MTLHSMTGYGQGEAVVEGNRVTIEITSLNHKTRDFRLGLDTELQSLEFFLIERLAVGIYRGTIHLNLDLKQNNKQGNGQRIKINRELIRQLTGDINSLAVELNLKNTLCISDLLSIPGVILTENTELPMEKIKEAAAKALDTALSELIEDRRREGDNLARELRRHGEKLNKILNKIDSLRDSAMLAYRDRLQKRIVQLQLELPDNDERLAKEIAFAAQRTDITEETVRLRSHLDQFLQSLVEGNGPIGRKLQFLCQEIQREINTVSAKTAESEIADLALEYKTELERIREQCSNIE